VVIGLVVLWQARISWDRTGWRDPVWRYSCVLLQTTARSVRRSSLCWSGCGYETCNARYDI